MLFSTATVLPLLLPVALASAAVNVLEKRQGVTCAAVHVFMARGNGEAYPGRVGAIANTVCEGLPSCDSENIMFDSSLSYCDQAGDGVSSGIQQITNYANSCPGSKIVLAGYSLGAQIVGDILGGGGGPFYNCEEANNAALDSGIGSHIAVVLMFGNVRHVANEPYNVGTGSGLNGQYPRTGASISSLNAYSNMMQDYCFSQDPICALGNDGYSHTTYMDVYANQAGAYAQQKLGMGGSTAPTSSSAAPTSTSSSAAPSSTSSDPPASSGSSTSTSYASSSSTSSGSSGAFGVSSSSSSSSLTLSSSSSSFSASTTTSASTTSTSSSTSSQPTYAYTASQPFVFSNTATEATTSTFVPSTFSSVASTYSAPAITTSASVSSTAPTTTSVPIPSSTTPALIQSSSNAAVSSNVGALTLNVVTLLVLKALVF